MGKLLTGRQLHIIDEDLSRQGVFPELKYPSFHLEDDESAGR